LIQKQIAKKIQESHRLRKESKELLEDAKRQVEEEIEKG
jgi:F0F1-type ATP synthase membrane subunit b/b'